MITIPTQKLFYKRFVYKIQFKLTVPKGSIVKEVTKFREIKNYIKALNIPCKTRADWNFSSRKDFDISYSVYLSDADVVDRTVDLFGDSVHLVAKPINEEHKRNLENKFLVEFRSRYFFNNFKYKVVFRYRWRADLLKSIVDWVHEYFDDRLNGRKGDYFFMTSYVAYLYIKDETDLTMIRLALGEHISSVTKVELSSKVPF